MAEFDTKDGICDCGWSEVREPQSPPAYECQISAFKLAASAMSWVAAACASKQQAGTPWHQATVFSTWILAMELGITAVRLERAACLLVPQSCCSLPSAVAYLRLGLHRYQPCL